MKAIVFFLGLILLITALVHFKMLDSFLFVSMFVIGFIVSVCVVCVAFAFIYGWFKNRTARRLRRNKNPFK